MFLKKEISYYVRACLSLPNRSPFPCPPNTLSLPLCRLHCSQTVFHKGWILTLGTDRSQQGPYQENMGDEEGLRIRIQSQQSWQLAMCEQAHCHARAEHLESIFLSFFLQFPGTGAAILLHNMHHLSCDLVQDNQS